MATIALALGAGGARGLAHVHVLRALDDLGVKPVAVAGTSIGAVMGAAYCAGMTGREIEEYILARLDDRARLIAEVFKIRPASLKGFFNDGGFRLGELNLETIFATFLPDAIPATFDDLSIPLHIVATDYDAGADKVFNTGDLRRPIAASAAMPAVFLPVDIAGRHYIDGSSTNPCPINVVAPMADHVLAIDVSGGSIGASGVRPRKMDVMYASNQIMQKTIAGLMAAACPATLLIRPRVDTFRALDFLSAAKIIAETTPLRDEVKRKIAPLLA